jgi:hypothetical protein
MRTVTIEFHIIFHFIAKWIAVWQRDLHGNWPNCL